MNGYRAEDKNLKVSIARPASNEIRNCKLYITNLPKEYTEKEVLDLFKQYGDIIECRVLDHKGVAFVQFNLKAQADKACSAVNGKLLDGHPVHLVVKNADDQHYRMQDFGHRGSPNGHSFHSPGGNSANGRGAANGRSPYAANNVNKSHMQRSTSGNTQTAQYNRHQDNHNSAASTPNSSKAATGPSLQHPPISPHSQHQLFTGYYQNQVHPGGVPTLSPSQIPAVQQQQQSLPHGEQFYVPHMQQHQQQPMSPTMQPMMMAPQQQGGMFQYAPLPPPPHLMPPAMSHNMMVYAPVAGSSEGSVCYTPNSPLSASPLGSPNQLMMSGAYGYPPQQCNPYSNNGGYHMMPTAVQMSAQPHHLQQSQNMYQGHGDLGVGYVDCSGGTGSSVGGDSDSDQQTQALPLTY
eukprot:gene35776-44114_t